jgi:hypothetical protein
MKEQKISNKMMHKFISVIMLVATLLMPVEQAYALSCSTGNGPVVKESACFLKTANCAVCNDQKTNWERPTIEVVYEQPAGIQHRATLGVSQCKWIFGVRFCARNVIAGTKEEGNQANRFGNTTGDPKKVPHNPKPQLCAYEDPLDGMDTNPGYNPHYWHEKNPAIGGATPAVALTIGGAVGGGLGVALASVVLAIMSHFNHVVITDLGCVDRPIADGPPPFSNDAWQTTYLPRPTLGYDINSTFKAPVIVLSFCQNATTQVPEICKFDANNKILNLISTLKLSPRETNKYDTRQAVKISYKEGGVIKTDDREFSARITTGSPDKIYVYKTKEASNVKGSQVAVEVFQGFLDRPGYMPLPTVSKAASSTASSPKISVAFPGDTQKIDIWPNPIRFNPALGNDPGNECKTLGQIEFCAIKKCLERNPDVVTTTADGQTISTLGDCKTWEDKVCAVGYNTAPTVLAKAPTVRNMIDQIDGAPIPVAGLPKGNVLKAKNVAFVNTAANQEIINNVKTPITITPKKDLLVYELPFCYQRDDNDKCTNYDGTCETKDSTGKCTKYVSNVTTDPYFKDVGHTDENGVFVQGTEIVRQASPDELSLCVGDPVAWVKNIPGTYTYTVPESCNSISVELWGAGGGGTTAGGNNNDWAGGGGAYVKATIKTTPNTKYTVQVGTGGDRFKKGGDTILSGLVVASGGSPKTGGSAVCSANPNVKCLAADMKKGQDGASASCHLVPGAGAWDPDKGVYLQWSSGDDSGTQQCDNKDGTGEYDPNLHIKDTTPLQVPSNYKYPPVAGVGGCASDKCPSNGIKYNGNVSVGGHGKARISCAD